MSESLERRIVTGLIVSNDFTRNMAKLWKNGWLKSEELNRVAEWCLEFYNTYSKVPDRDIENIYLSKKPQLNKADAEYIELMLTKISDEFERSDKFNSEYLFDQAKRYFKEVEIEYVTTMAADMAERGEPEKAEAFLRGHKFSNPMVNRGLELGSERGYERMEAAFAEGAKPIFTYARALGNMLNNHLVRGGFVAFLAPEKRGKTWLLQDMAFRALRHRCNVAFFQAGDLTETQQLRRIGIQLSGRSDNEDYCKEHWRSTGDCVFNQYDTCQKPDRSCDFGLYNSVENNAEALTEFGNRRTELESFKNLEKLAEDTPKYIPCRSIVCKDRKPTVWFKKEEEQPVLTGKEAGLATKEFFEKYKRRFRLVNYPSGMLTVDEVDSCLDEWEENDDFIADFVIIDYADLMTASIPEFRHRQNEVWMGLRGLSQRRHALVATATQADAASYRRKSLGLSNFSEDKRKYAHVTAMWGLNQDPWGREKSLGILRINEIVVREGPQSVDHEVTVLQDIRLGKPVLESFRV